MLGFLKAECGDVFGGVGIGLIEFGDGFEEVVEMGDLIEEGWIVYEFISAQVFVGDGVIG